MPAVVYMVVILGAAGIYVFQPWKWTMFEKGPPIKQVQVDQTKLAQAKLAQDNAQKALETAKSSERALKASQIEDGQEMVSGVGVALQNAPNSKETALARILATKAKLDLALAVGDLPKERQEEIEGIVAGELSLAQSEVDAANGKLAARDAEFAQVTKDRDNLKANVIPGLQKKLDTTTTKETAIETQYQQKVGEVVSWAAAKAKSDGVAATLASTVSFLERLGIACAIAYVFLAWVLPAIGMTFNPLSWLKDVAGYILSPLTHHDLKKQVVAATAPAGLTT